MPYDDLMESLITDIYSAETEFRLSEIRSTIASFTAPDRSSYFAKEEINILNTAIESQRMAILLNAGVGHA